MYILLRTQENIL